MAVINSAALDPTTVVMRMCVCVCGVCASVCVMSFIALVQLACPRVVDTVQCLGTKHDDEPAFCWQSGELGHLWSSIPEGKQCESKHPEELSTWTSIVYTHVTHHGHAVQQHCSQQNKGHRFKHNTGFLFTLLVCVCECVWHRMLRLGQLSLKQCYLYKYPGRLNDGHLEEHVSPAAIDADLLLSPCPDFIVVKILDVSQQTSECIYALYTSHCFYYFCENPLSVL